MKINKIKVIANLISRRSVKNTVKGSNIQYKKNSIKKMKNKSNSITLSQELRLVPA